MGAVLGLELIIRIANLTARFHQIEAGGGSEQNKSRRHERLRANAQAGTFGQIAAQFLELYPQLASDLLREAIDNAILFRNHLTHNYLAGHVRHLKTEKGLDLIATECVLYMDHFQRIERFIRAESGVQFHLFASGTDPETALGPHPLADWFVSDEDSGTQPA